jgi:hypothetical protein
MQDTTIDPTTVSRDLEESAVRAPRLEVDEGHRPGGVTAGSPGSAPHGSPAPSSSRIVERMTGLLLGCSSYSRSHLCHGRLSPRPVAGRSKRRYWSRRCAVPYATSCCRSCSRSWGRHRRCARHPLDRGRDRGHRPSPRSAGYGGSTPPPLALAMCLASSSWARRACCSSSLYGWT